MIDRVDGLLLALGTFSIILDRANILANYRYYLLALVLATILIYYYYKKINRMGLETLQKLKQYAFLFFLLATLVFPWSSFIGGFFAQSSEPVTVRAQLISLSPPVMGTFDYRVSLRLENGRMIDMRVSEGSEWKDNRVVKELEFLQNLKKGEFLNIIGHQGFFCVKIIRFEH